MGLFKKIFKPVRKVLDKVIPNEIKPALPYLAAFTPFMAPTTGFMGSMTGRALLSGGANIAAQLAQEGTTEDDLNLLSTGIAAATGALSAPGAGDKLASMTTKGQLAEQGIIGSQARMDLANRSLLQKGIDLGLTGASKAADFLSAEKMSGGIGDILRPGGTKMGFDAATATALGVPLAQGVGDAMYTEAVRLSKQEIIDDALSGLGEGASDADRALAIRTAMLQYGFGDDEIEETITAAGYKAGGRVGFRFGGIDAAIKKVEDDSIKESAKMVADMPDMDLMDLIEEFEIIFKRKPMSMEELKQFYRENYEMESPVRMREKIKEKVIVEAKDGGIMKAKRGLVNEPGGYAGELGPPLDNRIEGFGKKMVDEFLQGNLPEFKGERVSDYYNRPNFTDVNAVLKIIEMGGSFDDVRNVLNIDISDERIKDFIRFDQENKARDEGSMKDGGLMNLGGKEMDLRGGGFVPIGKKERADDVPARLSKNEFVMTADAVRAAGGGSVNKGAKRMYELMNNLEARV